MIILNDPITVNGREYSLYLQVTSKDGKEPHGIDLHLMGDAIKEKIEEYQDGIKDEI